MNKKTVTMLMSVALLAVFCFPVSAAASYPQESGSGAIVGTTTDGVTYYWTVDYRGFETSTYVGDFMPLKPHWTTTNNNNGSATNETIYGKVHMFVETATVYHVSMTIRNRTSKIAVADLNNFQLRANAVGFSKYPVGVCIRDSINADVYNVDLNDSSNNFYLNFRSISALTLQPDEQIDIQFDFCFIADYNSTGSLTDNPYIGTSSEAVSGNLGFSLTEKPSTFALYTIEEYANTYESFWSYLIRSLQRIISNNETPYQEVNSAATDVGNDSNDVSDTLDTVHAQEQQWYQQNTTAIESTGLSNYQFSNNQKDGLAVAVTQFTDLWSALGDWSTIYLFTLTLSLATFILRHRPSTKMQQRMKLRDAATESQIIKNQVATDYYSFKFNDAIDQRNERLAKSPNSDNVSGQSLIDIAIRRRNRK